MLQDPRLPTLLSEVSRGIAAVQRAVREGDIAGVYALGAALGALQDHFQPPQATIPAPPPPAVARPTARRLVLKRLPRVVREGLPKPVDVGSFTAKLARHPVRRGRQDPHLEASNCRALLLEVVRRAAYDWVLYRGSSRLDKRLLADSAYQWLFAECPQSNSWVVREMNEKELTSFMGICLVLDMDPDRLRTRIRAMTVRSIIGTGRPAERRRGKGIEEAIHSDDLRVFDVDVDALPVFDCMFAPAPAGG